MFKIQQILFLAHLFFENYQNEKTEKNLSDSHSHNFLLEAKHFFSKQNKDLY